MRQGSKHLTCEKKNDNTHIFEVKAHLQFSVMLEEGPEMLAVCLLYWSYSPTAITQKLLLLGATAVTQTLITHQISLSPPALINQSHFIDVIPTSWALILLPASGDSDTRRGEALLIRDKAEQMQPFNGANSIQFQKGKCFAQYSAESASFGGLTFLLHSFVNPLWECL